MMPVAFCQMILTSSSTLFRLSDRLVDDAGRAADALLIRMGVHPQRNRLVAVTQRLRDAGNIRAAGNGNGGKRVAQLVRVQVRNAAALGELVQIPRGTLRVHRFSAVLLCEHPLADRVLRLFLPQGAQHVKRIVINVDDTLLAVLRRIQIYVLLRGIAQVPGNRHRAGFEVDVLPMHGAALAAANARVGEKQEHHPPFERFCLHILYDPLHLLHGEGRRPRRFDLILAGLYNRHRIASVIRQIQNNTDDFPSMAEGDEYYIPLSFKDRKDKSFFIETLGRMPYTHLSRAKRYEYVEKGGYPLTFVDAIIENEKYRQRQLLNHVKYGDLQSQEKSSNAVYISKSWAGQPLVNIVLYLSPAQSATAFCYKFACRRLLHNRCMGGRKCGAPLRMRLL